MVLSLPVLVATADAAPHVETTYEAPEVSLVFESVNRAHFNTTGATSLLINLKRSRHFDMEGGLQAVLPSTLLFQAGFGRQLFSLDVLGDVLWTPGTFLSIGPSLSASVRTFLQQGEWITTVVVPQAGGRLRLDLLEAPRWRVGLQVRLIADLLPTDLLIGSATTRRLPPIAGHAGLFFAIGRDRKPARPPVLSTEREGV